MKFILEYKNYYEEGDIVLMEYWYNHMITPVKIKEKRSRSYLITHQVDGSEIFNAPDEVITSKDIIDHYRTKP